MERISRGSLHSSEKIGSNIAERDLLRDAFFIATLLQHLGTMILRRVNEADDPAPLDNGRCRDGNLCYEYTYPNQDVDIYHPCACTSTALLTDANNKHLPRELSAKNSLSNLSDASLYGDVDPLEDAGITAPTYL